MSAVRNAGPVPRLHWALFVSSCVLMAWSGYRPFDQQIWLLEVFPAMIGVVVIVATYRRFPLTDLVYMLIWLHALVLMVGGHYTYAENPLFNWLRDEFGLARNYYDRVGHLFQGFVPAIIAREILLRASPLTRGGWLFFLVCCVVLAISATYEFIEWWAALILGHDAEAFLATQGDPWDTQWDMFLAISGGIASQLLLRKQHDRQLERLLGTGAKAPG